MAKNDDDQAARIEALKVATTPRMEAEAAIAPDVVAALTAIKDKAAEAVAALQPIVDHMAAIAAPFADLNLMNIDGLKSEAAQAVSHLNDFAQMQKRVQGRLDNTPMPAPFPGVRPL